MIGDSVLRLVFGREWRCVYLTSKWIRGIEIRKLNKDRE